MTTGTIGIKLLSLAYGVQKILLNSNHSYTASLACEDEAKSVTGMSGVNRLIVLERVPYTE